MTAHRRQGQTAAPATVVILVAALCAIYMVSQFLRSSVGVIAPDIAGDLALSPEALGVLSSVFFFSFAAVQVPLGVAIDRFGPRRCMLASVGLAIAGCVVFAMSRGLFGLSVGRVLMGMGCSSFFMAPLTIYTRWFDRARFATLTGIQLGVGTLGTLIATAPLAYSTALMGWRASFLAIAALTAAIGVIVAIVVQDNPPGANPPDAPPASLMESVHGLGGIVAVPGFWPVFVMQIFAYSSFISVLGLWGGPYLTDVFGLDLSGRGNVLLVMAGAHIVGLFAWGPLDRLMPRKRLVEIGVLVTVALFVLIGLAGARHIGLVIGLLAGIGLSAAYVPVLTAHGQALFTREQVGRGITTINVATIGGVFVMQLATGAVIGAFEAGPGGGEEADRQFAAYQAMFWFLAVCQLLAWIYYRRAPDPRP